MLAFWENPLPEWIGKWIAAVLGLFGVIRFLVVYYTAREMRRNLDQLKTHLEGVVTRQPTIAFDTAWLQTVAGVTARQLIQKHNLDHPHAAELISDVQVWVFRGLLNGVHCYTRNHLQSTSSQAA
jgi:hypothetical protein